ILRALETGRFGRDAFTEYEAMQRRGMRHWYDFISMYYRLNFLFTAFVNDPRYRLGVLRLLQGDLYDAQEPPVLTEMKRIVRDVEQDPGHIWHRYLGDLRAEFFDPAYASH